jgi:hypothetical protein
MSSSGYLASGLAASGVAANTALVLKSGVKYFEVATCTSIADGVMLPAGQASGVEVKIRNSGAYTLSVYPPTGGTINGYAANVYHSIAPNSCSDIVFKDALTAFTFNNNSPYTYDTGGINAVLLPQYTGATVLVRQVNANVANTVTLPSPAIPGLFFNIILTTVTVTAARNCAIVSPGGAGTMRGSAMITLAANPVGVLAGGASTQLNFVSNAAAIGDGVYCVSDGTNWNVTAHTSIAGGITFT